jgi:hypothetical protein
LASICSDLLDVCLRGERWTEGMLREALAVDEGRAFLSIVVERLGDLFEPRLCDVYAELFTETIGIVAPKLMPRVRRAKAPGRAPDSAERVYVLSRVTLGADIAVTSVMLDAAKKRYPDAEIFFVGPRKNFELFEGDPRIRHFAAPYPRSSSLGDRLAASAALWIPEGVVIDPDSRLSQLGLIKVCDDDDYFFFESRSYGEEAGRLPNLAGHWAQEVFGVEEAGPYIAPLPASGPPADITVSLGVGENPAKRVEGDFERQLLQVLAETGAAILVDKGASVEERARVESALPPGVRTHDGAFAPFAAEIARSKLYVGYDSAGGHAASACGVSVICIGKGFVNERMKNRWAPYGLTLEAGPDVLNHFREALTCTFRR